MFELCDDLGSELEQLRWVSIDSDVDICEISGSDLDTESSEQEESLKHKFSEHGQNSVV